MLSFTFPWALGFLAAALLVALFYFLRMRFRRQPVSSTYLWQRLAEVNEGGARLRWRSVVLLLLQLLAVTALVLALAGLQLILSTPVKPGVLYVLDTSASMAAREPGRATRLETARQAILDDHKTLTGPVAVFTGDRRVFESPDGSGLEAFLGSVQAGGGEFHEGRAVEILGTWLQTHPGSWSGVLVSDGGLDQRGTRLGRLLGGRWRSLAFAGEAPNLGITDLRLGTSEARITVFNGFDRAVPADLALEHDGAVTAKREVLAPGTSVVAWTLPGAAGPGLWKVSFTGNQDSWSGDDEFTAAVETTRPARLLHLGSPDPFLKAAFPGARWEDRSGVSAEGGPWDLVITEGQIPSGWKGDLITFGALPPGAPVFWGPQVSGTLAGSPAAHPLARWVPWSDVDVAVGRGLVVQPGATVLAEAGGWPVAAAWEQEGARYLALGFGTQGSNLGLTAVLPVLMRNFRQATLPQEDNPLAANLRVGKSAVRAGGEGWRVVSSTAPSGTRALEAVRRGGLWELTPRETGVFTWADGADSGTLAVQFPAGESDTAPRAVASPPRAADEPGTGQRSQAVPLAPGLALAALGLLALEWRLWNGRFSPRANRGLAKLRALAAAAALLALAGLSFPWPTTERNLTLVFDTSASLGPELVEEQRQAALKLVGRLEAGDRVALVAFAGEPRILSGLQPRDEARRSLEEAPLTAPNLEGTDVQAALAAGAQLLADQPGASSQLVFTDGRANIGGGLDGLSGDARRFPVSIVPIGRLLGGVAGQGLELPAGVRPGEQARVVWQAAADQARTVVLELSVDGEPQGSVRRELAAGTNRVELAVPAGSSGTHRVEVAVRDEEGNPLPSAQASGLLTVEGKASVLLIRGPGAGSGLAAALDRQGLPVRVRGAAGLPEAPEGYQDLSAVILDNVAAPTLTDGQQQALKDWVAGGGGLLVVGGDASLGRGEYYSSKLEDLLPVQTDHRQRLQFTRSRLLFVVDHSGSMSEEVGTTTKLEAALGGIAQSLDELTVQDEVGLLEFDSEATWVLPFTSMGQKETIARALESFSQGGGTDLTKALDEVVLAFGRPGPVKRHVILMTDGQTGGDDAIFQKFTETMKAAQVSMTVLGIGHEVNDKLLSQLAAGSDGVYYRVQGSDIPAVLHKETVRVTRDLIQEGSFFPQPTGPNPVLELGGDPPPVLGYLVTQAKALARVGWAVRRPDGSRDPLYADWRYGAGRVAVFASDSGTKWLSPWSGRPEYNRFWAQAVRSIETGARDKALGLDLSVEASVARVVVEALDTRGRLRSGATLAASHEGRTYPLTETAPGRYEAALPLASPGLQLVTVTDQTGPGRTWDWVWNPTGAERAMGGIDWAGLGRTASGTGGLLQPLADPAPPPLVWAWSSLALRDLLLGLALVLFVTELGWRSLSLGQLAAARAQFSAWWKDQARPWAQKTAAPVARDEAEVERRTREAYKYLASRKRPGA